MSLKQLLQPTLFDSIPKSNRELAYEWMRANPHSVRLFEKFALEAAARGKKFGMKLLAERVRWECAIEADGDYKINNNYVAYIGRYLCAKHPHLRGFIEMRKVAA